MGQWVMGHVMSTHDPPTTDEQTEMPPHHSVSGSFHLYLTYSMMYQQYRMHCQFSIHCIGLGNQTHVTQTTCRCLKESFSTFCMTNTGRVWLTMLHFAATFLNPSLKQFRFVTDMNDWDGFLGQDREAILSLAKEPSATDVSQPSASVTHDNSATADAGDMPPTKRGVPLCRKSWLKSWLKAAWNKHGYFNVTGSTMPIFVLEIVFEIVIEIGKPSSTMPSSKLRFND